MKGPPVVGNVSSKRTCGTRNIQKLCVDWQMWCFNVWNYIISLSSGGQKHPVWIGKSHMKMWLWSYNYTITHIYPYKWSYVIIHIYIYMCVSYECMWSLLGTHLTIWSRHIYIYIYVCVSMELWQIFAIIYIDWYVYICILWSIVIRFIYVYVFGIFTPYFWCLFHTRENALGDWPRFLTSL